MDTDAACAAYKPDAYAAQGAQPQVLQLFAQYKAKNPVSVSSSTVSSSSDRVSNANVAVEL